MSDIEASTEAENPSEQIDPSTLSDGQSQAFDPHSATPLNDQKARMAAWEAATNELGGHDPDEPLITPKKAAENAAKKAAAKTLDVEATAEVDEEAPAEEQAEDEEAPAPKAKAKEVAKRPEKLTVAESKALAEQRVQMNERFQRRDAQWQANVAQREAQINARFAELEPLQKAHKLFEAGDLNGFAEALGVIAKDPSIKDWSTLNEAAINAVANPMYRRMRELERSNEEARKAHAASIEAQKAAQAEAAKAAEVASWKQSLADEAIADEDPAIGNLLTARPHMVEALFNIQQAHYHKTNEILPAREAAIKLLSNVVEDLKFWQQYAEEHGASDVLSELLGDQAPAKPVTKQTDRAARVLERQTSKKTSGGAVAPKQVAKPQVSKGVKNISQAQTTAASAVGNKSGEQLKKEYELRIQNDWRNAS